MRLNELKEKTVPYYVCYLIMWLLTEKNFSSTMDIITCIYTYVIDTAFHFCWFNSVFKMYHTDTNRTLFDLIRLEWRV